MRKLKQAKAIELQRAALEFNLVWIRLSAVPPSVMIQTGRQIDRQTGRQADRQTDRQTPLISRPQAFGPAFWVDLNGAHFHPRSSKWFPACWRPQAVKDANHTATPCPGFAKGDFLPKTKSILQKNHCHAQQKELC